MAENSLLENINWNEVSVVFKQDVKSIYRVFQKNGPLDYFDDNFDKYGRILTIFSLLQQENYGAQNLSYFSHLTFIMLPLYLAKQTPMQVSMSLLRHYCVCV